VPDVGEVFLAGLGEDVVYLGWDVESPHLDRGVIPELEVRLGVIYLVVPAVLGAPGVAQPDIVAQAGQLKGKRFLLGEQENVS